MLSHNTINAQSTINKVLNLGEINFINCLPVNLALQKHLLTAIDFETKITRGSPNDLNAMLRNGILDLAPISSFEFIKNRENYILINGISISSKKEADSVLFFIKDTESKSLEEALNKLNTVYLTNKSASSANLLKLILLQEYGLKDLNFINFDQNTSEMNAKLLIGDEALIEDQSQYNFILDLGAQWFEMNGGLPMVFGVWALSKQSTWSDSFESLRELENLFMRLKDMGLNNCFEEIICEAKRQTNLDEALLRRYFNNLDYSFSDLHRKSLELFGQKLEEAKLI